MGKKAWDIAREKRMQGPGKRRADGARFSSSAAGAMGGYAGMDAPVAGSGAAASDAASHDGSASDAALSPTAILYEDDWLIAVDKPAGIIVHGDGTGAVTLTDQLRSLLARRHGRNAPCVRELQALQRLDRDTCGIVLFCKQKAAQAPFDALIARHELRKEYLAMVEGRVPCQERTFDQPIGRDRHDARKMRASRTGKAALTHARKLGERRPGGRVRTLLAVTIETGRKHQIRVHLSHAGFPLVGDALYNPACAAAHTAAPHGNLREAPAGEPLMLQAHRVTFTHPATGKRVQITAPDPAWAKLP